MNYQTFPSQRDLSVLIKCFWTLEIPFHPQSEKQRILPDGCIEMCFLLGDDIKRYSCGEAYIIQPRAFILGQISEGFYVQPTGAVNSFAVRFYPYAFSNYVSMPLNKLANKETPLDQVFGKEIAASLEEGIRNAPSTKIRIKIIEDFFLEKSKDKSTLDELVQSTVDTILSTDGCMSIQSAIEKHDSKRRQLERLFAKKVGISPKQFAKVVRLQAVLKFMLQQNPKSLTNIAYETNYFDQSHFIRDFKEFTGSSPKDFYKNGELLLSSTIYKEDSGDS